MKWQMRVQHALQERLRIAALLLCSRALKGCAGVIRAFRKMAACGEPHSPIFGHRPVTLRKQGTYRNTHRKAESKNLNSRTKKQFGDTREHDRDTVLLYAHQASKPRSNVSL